jgi:hypothetical protein
MVLICNFEPYKEGKIRGTGSIKIMKKQKTMILHTRYANEVN